MSTPLRFISFLLFFFSFICVQYSHTHTLTHVHTHYVRFFSLGIVLFFPRAGRSDSFNPSHQTPGAENRAPGNATVQTSFSHTSPRAPWRAGGGGDLQPHKVVKTTRRVSSSRLFFVPSAVQGPGAVRTTTKKKQQQRLI